MSTAMYDAREAMIPGSVYDRSSTGKGVLTSFFESCRAAVFALRSNPPVLRTFVLFHCSRTADIIELVPL